MDESQKNIMLSEIDTKEEVVLILFIQKSGGGKKFNLKWYESKTIIDWGQEWWEID